MCNFLHLWLILTPQMFQYTISYSTLQNIYSNFLICIYFICTVHLIAEFLELSSCRKPWKNKTSHHGSSRRHWKRLRNFWKLTYYFNIFLLFSYKLIFVLAFFKTGGFKIQSGYISEWVEIALGSICTQSQEC